MAGAIFFIIYFVVSVAMARRYYRRRHGVRPYPGAPGLWAASYIGMVWPITTFLAGVRDPALCYDPVHVQARNRAREILAMRRAEG